MRRSSSCSWASSSNASAATALAKIACEPLPLISAGVRLADGVPIPEGVLDGFVAKFGGEGDSGWSQAVKREIRLGRETEQLADELSLADRIPFNQPSHAALSDHVHCLDTLQRPPRTLKGSVAIGQPNSLFDVR